MQKNYAIITVIIAMTAILGISGWMIIKFVNNQAADQNQAQIAATIFPVADMAQNITGTDLEVATILPPGASPHTFEPTPELIKSLQNVKIIFAIGHGLDDWISQLTSELPNARIVYVDQGITLHPFAHEDVETDHEDEHAGGMDPHYWLSGQNAQIISNQIAQALSAIFPEQAEAFEQNTAAYQAALVQMDESINAKLQSLDHKQLITHHHSWGYFADAYNLQIVGSFEAEPGNPPTPTQLADLQSLVDEYGISSIYIEPQLPEDLVKPFADDLNIQINILDPLGGVTGRMSYIELMNSNAQTIANTL